MFALILGIIGVLVIGVQIVVVGTMARLIFGLPREVRRPIARIKLAPMFVTFVKLLGYVVVARALGLGGLWGGLQLLGAHLLVEVFAAVYTGLVITAATPAKEAPEAAEPTT